MIKKSKIEENYVLVDNVIKTFNTNNKKKIILSNVNFQISKGEFTCILGPSGCGKSTFARAIIGLVEATDGEVVWLGQDLTKMKDVQRRETRKEIQMIFQDPYSSLNPRFKVRDIIAEPLKFYQKDLTQVDLQSNIHDLIDIAGMSRQSLDRYPHEFSGGQRQRISIARALATRPRLLICDEPTSALDVSIQAQILNLLKDIQDELHLTMLFISHDLPVIRQMCNRIVVLKDGNVCEINDSESLFNRPQHSYTKQLIDLMPKIESLV